MRIIIAPDSFKDGLKSKDAAKAILKGFKKVHESLKYLLVPISDGGEGLLSVLTDDIEEVVVTGPTGSLIKAAIGFLDDKKTVVIEMALAAGMEKVAIKDRNPYHTTTYGVGELVLKALDYNPKRIILGLGGSTTNDLGIGALNALGLKLLDEENNEVDIYGKDLFKIKKLDTSNLDLRLNHLEFILATDVTNPLLGKNGATYIYGLQKGLKEKDLKKFDKTFKDVSELFNLEFKKDLTSVSGAGAAGGLAYVMATVFGGKITPGFKVVYEHLNLKEKMQNADILITGEGKIDQQTLSGKAPFLISKKALEINPEIKVYAFTGTNGLKHQNIFTEIIEINDKNLPLKMNIEKTKEHLKNASAELAKRILNVKKNM